MPYRYREDMDHTLLSTIPVSELELSPDTVELIKKKGLVTVGDCIQFFITASIGTGGARGDYMTAMVNEVMPSLIEHGYWSYLEEFD